MRACAAHWWPARQPSSGHLGNIRSQGALASWLAQLLKRKPRKLVAVALANKLARIAWKLMVTGEAYTAKMALTAFASAA